MAPSLVANFSACYRPGRMIGRWSIPDLSAHGVHPHNAEWLDGGCCQRRNGFGAERWAPKLVSEVSLKQASTRLLVVVVGDSRNSTRATVLANTAALSQLETASVQYVVVAAACTDWSDVLAGSATLGVPFLCVEQPLLHDSSSSSPDAATASTLATQPSASPASTSASAYNFRPKLPMQLAGVRAALARARGSGASASEQPLDAFFDAVWLPDIDIVLTTDALRAFLVRWACAFSAGPPYVAQPVLHGATRTVRSQQFWPFNFGLEWQPGGRLADLGVLAMHTAYIEQQAPIFEAGFFAWFAHEIGATLASWQESEGTDIATDQLWCRAAAHYGVGRRPRGAESSTAPAPVAAAPPSCAVIPVPFRHRGEQRKRPAKFWRGTGTVRGLASEKWPQHWLDPTLLSQYKLSSSHIEPSRSLHGDRCMVRYVSSTRLGAACFAGSTPVDGS
jgi:hypothetical protein